MKNYRGGQGGAGRGAGGGGEESGGVDNSLRSIWETV